MSLDNLKKEFKIKKKAAYKKHNLYFIHSISYIYVIIGLIVLSVREGISSNMITVMNESGTSLTYLATKLTDIKVDRDGEIFSQFLLQGMHGISCLLFILSFYLFFKIFNKNGQWKLTGKKAITFLTFHWIFFLISTKLLRDYALFFETILNRTEWFYIGKFCLLFSLLFCIFKSITSLYKKYDHREYADSYSNFITNINSIFIQHLTTKEELIAFKKFEYGDKNEKEMYYYFIETKKREKELNIDEILINKYCKNKEVLYNE